MSGRAARADVRDFEKRDSRAASRACECKFTHEWGGPIAFRSEFLPIFARHPKSDNGIVLGIFAGHGVALSVYLGTWAAEVLLGRQEITELGANRSEANARSYSTSLESLVAQTLTNWNQILRVVANHGLAAKKWRVRLPDTAQNSLQTGQGAQ